MRFGRLAQDTAELGWRLPFRKQRPPDELIGLPFKSSVALMASRSAVQMRSVYFFSACLVFGLALAATKAASPEEVRTGKAAFGDWRSDAPGVRRHLRASDLPAASTAKSVANFPDTVEMPAGASPRVPKGLAAEMVASGLKGPRVIRFAPNGDMFVADSKADQIRVFRIADGSAKPSRAEIFATGLHQPYGIAFYPPGSDLRWVYVANSHSIVRFPYKSGDLQASGPSEVIVDNIPAAHHWTRDIAFSPDATNLYLSVGSGSNVALDMFPQPLVEGGLEEWKKTRPLGAAWDTEERRADILVFDPEGKNERIFATGLRNCSGLTVQPVTGDLWCVVNERDELGDDVPFEYATRVRQGAFYGWPWYYNGNHEDPRRKGERPDLASHVAVPDVFIQAHSAPLGITFYEGSNLPAEYKGDAFVTLHGSWNRGKRTGYKVVRLLFKDGKPTGEYEDFITGFVISDAAVWGRPVGIAVARDGSVFVSEDGSGTIWRIAKAH